MSISAIGRFTKIAITELASCLWCRKYHIMLMSAVMYLAITMFVIGNSSVASILISVNGIVACMHLIYILSGRAKNKRIASVRYLSVVSYIGLTIIFTLLIEATLRDGLVSAFQYALIIAWGIIILMILYFSGE